MYEDGSNISKIAQTLKVSRPTILKIINKQDQDPDLTPKQDPPLLDKPSKGLVRKREKLESRKYDIALASTDKTLESIQEEKNLRERRKLLERQLELNKLREKYERNKEERQIKLEEENEREQALLHEGQRQKYLADKLNWLSQKTEDATRQLKRLIPYDATQALTTKGILAFKEEVQRNIQPLYGKESNSTIEDLLKELTKDFFQQYISTSPIFKKINKEKLVQEGTRQLIWETFHDDLDWNEKKELEEYVKEKLERNLTGDESEIELKRIVKNLVNRWFKL